MPYEGEYASKSAHSDILKNPQIREFLADCDYLKPPSDAEAQALADRFIEPGDYTQASLPDYVISVDGSNHETSMDDKLPSTKIGYIKTSSVLISLDEFGSLHDVQHDQFVDPFKVAKLQNSKSSLTFFIPSANIHWQGHGNVRDSFRALVDQQLYAPATRFDEKNPYTSLRSTLFHLASRRSGKLATNDPKKLKLHRCPNCSQEEVLLEDIPDPQFCPNCKQAVYPSDCLRIWEEVNDFQSNAMAIGRLMMVLEHLIPFHYIRYFNDTSPVLLAGMAFFFDGPLAVFGTSAWMHLSIMRYVQEVNQRLDRFGLPLLLMIGLQKTGQVIDHVNLIDRFLPNNTIYPIDDDYRYEFILNGKDASGNGFGYETYYGQDFIFKTPSGRTFVFALPYPYANKNLAGRDFRQEKVKLENYPQLDRALRLITHFESDLYKNAVVPIALAHRYTAISLQPGGRVLDLLTKQGLKGN